MNDLLTRAWDLLLPEERPVGLFRLLRHTGPFCDAKMNLVGDAAAYDRLTLALERRLLRAGFEHKIINGEHDWWHGTIIVRHTDQLTAACLAAEAGQ